MSSFDDFLRSIFISAPAAPGEPPLQRYRVPFIFTSDYRLYNAGTPFAKDTSVSAFETISSTGQVIESGVLFSDQQRLESGVGLIRMSINPKTIRWTQNKRITKKDTITGSTYQHFLNPDGQNNDILTLDFTGTTGNIQLTDQESDKLTNGYNKLKQFHELYNLTREPKIYMDLNTNRWTENKFHIIYETTLFPMGLRFTGFFNSVMTFEENAEDPFKRDYSFSFVVETTYPSLDSLSSILSTQTQRFIG